MTEYAPTAETVAIPAAMIHWPTGRIVGLFDTWPRAGEYTIAPVCRAVIPEGKRQVGETMYRFAGTHVAEVVTLEDVAAEDGQTAETEVSLSPSPSSW